MSRRPNLTVRALILDAACRLIHRNGFNGTSVDDVAAAAKVKKANLFHYYPSKEVLGIAVLEHSARRSREVIAGCLSQEGLDPISAVARMFSEAAARMKENNCSCGCLVGNLAQELSDQNEKVRELVSEFFRSWTMQLAGFLDRGRATGYFRPELDPEESAEAIISLYEGALLVCKAKKHVSSLQRAEKMAVRYLESFKA